MLAQTTLRAVLSQHDLDEVLSEPKKLDVDVQAILDSATETWGIKVSNVEIRTVELTDNIARAIAKRAEVEGDRGAKIIHADAEFQASQTLLNAATILGGVPAAMPLRYLQTLSEIGRTKFHRCVPDAHRSLQTVAQPHGKGGSFAAAAWLRGGRAGVRRRGGRALKRRAGDRLASRRPKV